MTVQPAVSALHTMPLRPGFSRAPRTVPGHAIERIVLTGFMGSGKSTVGRILADNLGWTFIDLDTRIEHRTGKSVPELFAERGESGFRREETAALAVALRTTKCVIALGGGAPETLGNRLLLEQTPGTHVVFLDAPFEALAERCAAQAVDPAATARPNFADIEDARKRFEARLPLYRRLAQTQVATAGRSPEETTSEIRALVVPGATSR